VLRVSVLFGTTRCSGGKGIWILDFVGSEHKKTPTIKNGGGTG